MGLVAFTILFGYEIARSPIESLFLKAYTSAGLPQVWIAVALAAVVVTTIYSRLAGRRSLPWLFAASSLTSAVLFGIIAGWHAAGLPHAEFALYVWKDVYVVVLIEIFWSGANTAFRESGARWLYGLFCILGSAGSFCGGMLVAAVAQDLGTLGTVGLVLPTLLLSAAQYRLMLGQRVEKMPPAGGLLAGWSVLRDSRYLWLMLGLIALVQIVVTLVDYQYNTLLEASYPDMDTRTAIGGQVYAAISLGSMSLQVLTGPILTLMGVRLTLLAIPMIIGGTVAAFALSPQFVTMAIAKVAGKCFDYSLFRAGKEILYIPLSYAEKTQGKAFVDVMTYRVAKGGVSVLLLTLPAALVGAGVLSVVTLAAVGGWGLVTLGVTRLWRQRSEG
ncbi:MAG: AAA family ATP:ADP antiporter [Myxococcota bacterium]|jgi:AAA family ATP:ADP antiporter